MYIDVFGKQIPLYGVFFYLGIMMSAIAGIIICKIKKFPVSELIYSAVYSLIGGLLGAKLLFILVSFRQIIELNLPLISIIKGGFVFYGGLFGAILGLLIYSKQFKVKALEYADIYALLIPFGHAFGRVGCFFAGCCYGIPFKYGHVYTETAGMTPIGVPLLQIQLIEALVLFLLFFVEAFTMLRKCPRNGFMSFMYMNSYAAIRFVLEFFRGDIERGKFLFLSTAQWISILIFIVSNIWYHNIKKQTKERVS